MSLIAADVAAAIVILVQMALPAAIHPAVLAHQLVLHTVPVFLVPDAAVLAVDTIAADVAAAIAILVRMFHPAERCTADAALAPVLLFVPVYLVPNFVTVGADLTTAADVAEGIFIITVRMFLPIPTYTAVLAHQIVPIVVIQTFFVPDIGFRLIMFHAGAADVAGGVGIVVKMFLPVLAVTNAAHQQVVFDVPAFAQVIAVGANTGATVIARAIVISVGAACAICVVVVAAAVTLGIVVSAFAVPVAILKGVRHAATTEVAHVILVFVHGGQTCAAEVAVVIIVNFRIVAVNVLPAANIVTVMVEVIVDTDVLLRMDMGCRGGQQAQHQRQRQQRTENSLFHIGSPPLRITYGVKAVPPWPARWFALQM